MGIAACLNPSLIALCLVLLLRPTSDAGTFLLLALVFLAVGGEVENIGGSSCTFSEILSKIKVLATALNFVAKGFLAACDSLAASMQKNSYCPKAKDQDLLAKTICRGEP